VGVKRIVKVIDNVPYVVTSVDAMQVRQALMHACGGQGLDVLTCEVTWDEERDVHGGYLEIAWSDERDDAIRWLIAHIEPYLDAYLGVTVELVEDVRTFDEERGASVYIRVFVKPQRLDAVLHLKHVPGRECERSCALCRRLRSPDHGREKSVRLIEWVKARAQRQPPMLRMHDPADLSRVKYPGWRFRVGDLTVSTLRCVRDARDYTPFTSRTRDVYVYSSSVWRGGLGTKHGGCLVEQVQCLTVDEAHQQHRDLLLLVAQGEFDD
jgi:hypothetical protein